VRADEQERGPGEVRCQGTGDLRGKISQDGFPVVGDLDDLHQRFENGVPARLPCFFPNDPQLPFEVAW